MYISFCGKYCTQLIKEYNYMYMTIWFMENRNVMLKNTLRDNLLILYSKCDGLMKQLTPNL